MERQLEVQFFLLLSYLKNWRIPLLLLLSAIEETVIYRQGFILSNDRFSKYIGGIIAPFDSLLVIKKL